MDTLKPSVIRFPQLRKKLGYVGRSTIFRWERSGTFPRHIQLGANSVGWLEIEVDEWIASRMRTQNGGNNNETQGR